MKLLSISLMLMMCFSTSLEAVTVPDIGELPNENQVPRLVTMNFYKDAGKEMAFRWNTTYWTDTDLEMVLANDGDFNSSNVLHFQGSCERSSVANDGFIHSVVATNLSPNETYLYRVGDKELDAWSSIGVCKTENDESVTHFVHISDPQVSEEAHAKGYQETLYAIDELHPDFICITGDMVNNSWTGYTPILEQWEWSITYQEVLRNYPVMTVAGNHEAADYDYSSRYNLPYAENQDLVNGGYYSFDYHNIHFVALNTNDSNSDVNNLQGLSTTQLKWLENDLSNTTAKWKVVMMHKGLFDAGGHCSNLEGADGDIALIREQVAPLLNKCGVNLVLQGHDHLYSRSYPIVSSKRNGEFYPETKEETKIALEKEGITYDVYQDPSGPIYVNTGSASGSKYYGVVGYDKEMIPLEKAYGSNYKMFTSYVADDQGMYACVYELINGEAVLHDAFGIIKTAETTTNHGIGKAAIIAISIGVIVAVGVIIGAFWLSKKKGVSMHG